MLIEFYGKGVHHSLTGGQSFGLSKDNVYRDTAESTLRTIIQEIDSGKPWRDVIYCHFAESNRWLYDIITHPSRDRFFRRYPPRKGTKVLDIGSGWGQIALPLSLEYEVCALEPTPERMEFIIAVAKQERLTKNLCFVNADYMDVSFKTRFDLICCIGVLEWVGAFSDNADPQKAQQMFLEKMKSELCDGGVCVIGIENRLGLKYIMGAPDDHISVPDIAVFDANLAKEKSLERLGRPLRTFTYSMAEYRSLLTKAGFRRTDFFAAFPDYKLPEVVIPLGDQEAMNGFLRDGNYILEHSGIDGTQLDIQAELRSHYLSLAELGIAHFFPPSFYIMGVA